ncbi:MAG: sulfur carrier protein ThiS [Phycisphaerae bacterium]
MTITVNGQTTEIAGPLNLAQLIAQYELTPNRVAIEVNRELVRRAEYPDKTIADGDTIEIVTLVGGG